MHRTPRAIRVEDDGDPVSIVADSRDNMNSISGSHSPLSMSGPGSYEDPQQIPTEQRRKILFVMCMLKVLTSYDSGAFTACLTPGGDAEHGIIADLELSVFEQGVMGSSIFVGSTIGCASAAFLFARYNAKDVLSASFLVHTLATFAFAASENFFLALLARFIVGISLAFVVVYGVVWVDIFAPKNSATFWLGLMNIGVPIGTLLGFIAGAVIPGADINWRWVFYVKVPICVLLVLVLQQSDPLLLNERRPAAERIASSSLSHQVQVGKALFKNSIFVCSVASLCVLYFVISSISNFIPNYLKAPPFNASMDVVIIQFGLASISAAVAGAVFGGLLMDRLGGYQGNLHSAAYFTCIAGIAASWCSLGTTFMKTSNSFIIAFWFMLLFGAATVPVTTGMIMASVPTALRSQSSAIANICSQCSYALGPLFLSTVAEIMGGDINIAVHICLMMSALGGVPMVLNIYYALQNNNSNNNSNSGITSGGGGSGGKNVGTGTSGGPADNAGSAEMQGLTACGSSSGGGDQSGYDDSDDGGEVISIGGSASTNALHQHNNSNHSNSRNNLAAVNNINRKGR